MNVTLKSNLIHILLVLIGGLFLGSFAFYNRFPIVFSDTGTYILSGIENTVPVDRSLVYGIFLRHTSLAESIWIPVILQSIILSYLLYAYFHFFSASRHKKLVYLFFIAFITLFTGASLFSSTILPDIFTSIAALSLGLLLFVRKIKIVHFILISFFMFLGIGVHNSHFLILVLIMFFFTIAYLIKPWRQKFIVINTKRIIYLWVLLIFTNLSVATLHYAYGNTFSATRGGHVFLVARLNEMSLLKPYLDEHCEEKKYALCACKDDLPWDFIWSQESPIVKLGGWEATKSDFNRISRDMLTDGYYLKMFVIKSGISSVTQFFSFDAGDYVYKHDHTSPVIWPLDIMFKHELKQFSGSLQNARGIDFSTLNNRQQIVVFFSLTLLIGLLFLKVPPFYRSLALYILLVLLLNAVICGSLSGVFPRYQSRLVWLVTLPCFIYFSNTTIFKKIIEKFKLTEQ